MRKVVVRFSSYLLLAMMASVAQADTIINVLNHSHEIRLKAMPVADVDSLDARVIRANFEKVLKHMPTPVDAELRVVRGTGLAEAMQGRMVVVHESVAQLPETVQLFVLAHELGHIAHAHWSQMGLLFQKWVPGEVTQQHTDAVSMSLGREASALSHQQEYDADAFAMRILRSMGRSEVDVADVFACLGVYRDTATHPGSFRRIAALRRVSPQNDIQEARVAD